MHPLVGFQVASVHSMPECSEAIANDKITSNRETQLTEPSPGMGRRMHGHHERRQVQVSSHAPVATDKLSCHAGCDVTFLTRLSFSKKVVAAST